jgi:hypothetical protein
VRRLILSTFEILGMLLLLYNILFVPDWLTVALSSNFLFAQPSNTIWTVFLWLVVYALSSMFINLCRSRQTITLFFWIGIVLIISLIRYPVSKELIVFLGGITIGQGTVLWRDFWVDKAERESEFFVLFSIVCLLALASIWKSNQTQVFKYQGYMRWVGPWDNPNTYGLLMGTGAILAAGLGVEMIWSRRHSCSCIIGIHFLMCFGLVGMTTYGLMRSFSRGAWLGTGFGFICLLCSLALSNLNANFRYRSVCFIAWLQKNFLSVSFISIAALTFAFWLYRDTNLAALRICSMANVSDFSWRNRVSAWKGALQITSDRPWFGAGWNRTLGLYENFYPASKLHEHAAINMNDYLMVGSTLGILALFCFGMYIWLSLNKTKSPNSNLKQQTQEQWLKTTCRAGAIVLLVGFWFDGGLFKLPTAATFWILLELGRDD